MTVLQPVADREDSDVRFARALHRHGLRQAQGWLDSRFEGLSQTAIASEVQVSRPTISGLAHRAGSVLVESRSGLALDPRKNGYAVGIDFGQAHHRVALADIHGQLFEPADPLRYETEGNSDPASISFGWAAERIPMLLEEANLEPSRIWAVGVSLPGPVNARTRRLQQAPAGMDRSWEIVDVRLPLHLALPTPTVESDYNASALTEHLWGATRRSRDALYVKIGQRCACSLLVDHRIYRGSDGLAGRLGKTAIANPDGAEEEWVLVEDVFSLAALCRGDYADLSAIELVDRASNDPVLNKALRRGARGLGVALAPIIDALNPESVVIGGALGTASLAWIAADLIDGINSTGTSPARLTISERLGAGAFSQFTAIRGVMASALLADAPTRIAAAMAVGD
ncbi:MAG TPA: ROK family protein [Solirubrobacterales bacterium]|nr:ROK family protein [Solirubrobacterales bacterium]